MSPPANVVSRMQGRQLTTKTVMVTMRFIGEEWEMGTNIRGGGANGCVSDMWCPPVGGLLEVADEGMSYIILDGSDRWRAAGTDFYVHTRFSQLGGGRGAFSSFGNWICKWNLYLPHVHLLNSFTKDVWHTGKINPSL